MPENVERSEAIRKACYEFYQDYRTVAFTADHLKVSPTTVQKYFKEFADIAIKETDQCFLERQRITKDRILYKLDKLIYKAEQQLKRLETSIDPENKDADIELITSLGDSNRVQQLINKIHGDLIQWNQQKAGIEDTPTIDISIGKLLEDRVHELDKREEKLNELEQEIINKKRK
jgi:hypothetical protein